MKLSFSIPGKSSSAKSTAKPVVLAAENGEREEKQREFVTEFDPSKTRASQKRPSYVIPPKENEWRPHKSMKNIHNLASLGHDKSAEDNITFEVAGDMADGSGSNVSYGLTVRQSEDGAASNDGSRSTYEKPIADSMLEKLKFDLHRLPDDQGFKEFEDVPVEGFGAALLAGYGWKEGRGIGKNAKNDVEVKQYYKRTGKEGLGFTATDSEMINVKDNQKVKDGSKEKHGNKDRKADGFGVGQMLRVVTGSRDVLGYKATVLERVGSDWLRLKLVKTGKEVGIPVSDVAALGSAEEDKCLKKLKELKIRTEEQSGGKRNTEHSRGTEKRDVDRVKVEKERGTRTRWLRNHIRVRIISKDLKGGRLYRKKAEVVDVVGPYMCDVSMDESRELVQGVDQDLLETALPRSGGPVLVLYGKHEGAYGKLVKRDLDEETAIVQDLDTQEFLNVKLEQIAEYIGDPSDIGY